MAATAVPEPAMPFDSSSFSHYPVLSAMLAPALFLTASAALLTNANNRLARISDRLRALLSEIEAGDVELAEPRRDILHRRTTAILRSIRLLQLAICAFVATSLAISVDAVAQLHMPLLPTVLAMVGVVLLFGGTLEMWREAGLSVKSLEILLERSRRKVPKSSQP
jgi:Protein of unknown function (DUF2721)